MPDIYEQHRAAFRFVSAYVVVSPEGRRVATVAFKRPRGEGKVCCYLHILGAVMVRAVGWSADYAAEVAASKIEISSYHLADTANAITIRDAIVAGSGIQAWIRRLEASGYSVFQAV